MNLNAQRIIDQIAAIVTQIIGYGLLLLMLAMVLQQFGVRVPYVPTLNPTVAVYLFGCWWLFRK